MSFCSTVSERRRHLALLAGSDRVYRKIGKHSRPKRTIRDAGSFFQENHLFFRENERLPRSWQIDYLDIQLSWTSSPIQSKRDMQFSTSWYRSRRSSLGMTIVELLVVLVTIAIVMALLIPSLQSARMAARRMQCMSNIHQICIGVATYETVHKELPASIEFGDRSDRAYAGNGMLSPESSPVAEPNWLVRILPYTGSHVVHDKFRFSLDMYSEANRQARGTMIPAFLCPDDSQNDIPFGRAGEGDNWARGNYAANASHGHFPNGAINPYQPWTQSKQDWIKGMMGANSNLKLKEITDGLSRTILVAEVKIGLVASDRRGTWAMGAPGASSIWAHATDDLNGPNSCSPFGDNIWGGEEIIQEAGLERIRMDCMSVAARWNKSTQSGPRSRHDGGINVGFGDGSVRFISNGIQTRTGGWELRPEYFGVWEKLTGSADGSSVSDESY